MSDIQELKSTATALGAAEEPEENTDLDDGEAGEEGTADGEADEDGEDAPQDTGAL